MVMRVQLRGDWYRGWTTLGVRSTQRHSFWPPQAFFGTLRRIMLTLLFYLLLPGTGALPNQSTGAGAVTRACAEGWDSTGPKAKKKLPKHAKEDSQDKGAACIELAFSTLEIQEYLQSYVRSQQWKIGEEHLTEDSWSFSRELSKDELLGFTNKNANLARVNWSGGAALVHVSTVQVAEGFARTVIRATFRGYGQNADQFAQQREYWELGSSNSLETSIRSALEAHFKSAK
jgi:hypothetical protein